MEKLKLDINRYKKKTTNLCKTEWQQFAKDTCREFGVIHPYDQIVFKYAKSNLTFLKAQVINLQESATIKKEDTKTYGRLLTWKLNQHKKKPAKQTTAPLKPSATCTKCTQPINREQHQWRGLSFTQDGKTQTEFQHTNCKLALKISKVIKSKMYE